MPKLKTILSAFLLTTALTLPSLAQETTKLSEEDRTDIRITVYNGNFAAISETRTLSVGEGLNLIEFADVSAQIQSETALLEGGEFTFLEQNFDYDLLSPGKLIEKAVGKTILVERTNPRTGRTSTEEALVLSTNNGVVLQFEDSIEIFGQGGLPERFSFKEIPENLRAKPTLTTLVNATSNYDGDVRLSYLTGGFVWKADYVGNLSADETMMDIQAWVTLTNNSGTNFSNVRLQVLAGEVSRVTQRMYLLETADMGFNAKSPAPPPEAIGDFHLYTIPFKTDLKNNQTKQVALFSADDVPVEKFYVFDAQGTTQNFEPVLVYYEFDNSDENNLGNPIPQGVFRIYAKDSGGEAQFLGENFVPNTPEDQRVILPTGKAFDVTVQEKQTFYKREDRREENKIRGSIETFGEEVTFHNAKDKPVTVRFFLRPPGNWEILEENLSHIQEDSNTIFWEVLVPAQGEATLSYKIKGW